MARRTGQWIRVLAAATLAVATGSTPIATAAAATPPDPDAIKAALDSRPDLRVPNSYWSKDASGKVVISISASAPSSHKNTVRAAAAEYGGRVSVREFSGSLSNAAITAGGYGITPGSWNCTLGFNVAKQGATHFVTAGHCTKGTTYWYLENGGTYLGTTAGTVTDSSGDYGVVRYSSMASSVAKYGTVYQYTATDQDITTSAWPTQGSWVCHSGITTGKRCGSVQNTCATVNYDTGERFTCMTQVGACIDRGDSGGPLWRYSTALGIASGGVIGCASNPTGPSFYTPLPRALARYGLAVY